VLQEDPQDGEIIARVAALDVGKAELVCCVRVPHEGKPGRRLQEVQTYSTMTCSLLADRLRCSFYEALGWSGAQQPDDEVCLFQAGGMVFDLWTALGGHGAPGIELAHNVRSPEEVAAVLAEA
jgi:hypothetical protein